jgi:ubiquitin C-terminal hydrolase
MSIHALPRILILHLKRFKYSEQHQNLIKLNHRVAFPRHLTLTPSLTAPPGTPQQSTPTTQTYQLTAAVVHIGTSLSHGHYVTVAQDATQQSWFLIDDDEVQKVDKDVLETIYGSGDTAANDNKKRAGSAYILFYQQMNSVDDAPK